MRELTNTEMKTVIAAAKAALPPDAKDNIIVILAAAEKSDDIWINRISTCNKQSANDLIIRWTQNILNREEFGTPNTN